ASLFSPSCVARVDTVAARFASIFALLSGYGAFALLSDYGAFGLLSGIFAFCRGGVSVFPEAAVVFNELHWSVHNRCSSSGPGRSLRRRSRYRERISRWRNTLFRRTPSLPLCVWADGARSVG